MTNIEIAIKLAEDLERFPENICVFLSKVNIKFPIDFYKKLEGSDHRYRVKFCKELKVFIYKDCIIPVSKEFLAMVNKCLNIEQPSPTFQKGGPTPTNNEPTPKVNRLTSSAYDQKLNDLIVASNECLLQIDKANSCKITMDRIAKELNEMNPFN